MAAAKRKHDETLPIALSTLGGLLATLTVLLIGTVAGHRAWVLLVKAAMTFLLISGILKFLTTGVLTAVRWKATKEKDNEEQDDEGPAPSPSEEAREPARVTRDAAPTLETTEKVAT